MGTDGARASEARRHIDRGSKGESDERTNTRNGHEATADCIVTGKADEQIVKLGEPVSERPANGQQRGDDDHQLGIASELGNPPFKIPSSDLAEIVADVPKESANFIFQVEKLRSQHLSSRQNRPKASARGGLDMDGLVEPDAIICATPRAS